MTRPFARRRDRGVFEVAFSGKIDAAPTMDAMALCTQRHRRGVCGARQRFLVVCGRLDLVEYFRSR